MVVPRLPRRATFSTLTQILQSGQLGPYQAPPTGKPTMRTHARTHLPTTARLTLVLLLSATSLLARAADSDQTKLPAGAQIGNYVGEDVMIPMRDGVKLHAEVWRPKGVTTKLPILMTRSPYGFGVARVTSAF